MSAHMDRGAVAASGVDPIANDIRLWVAARCLTGKIACSGGSYSTDARQSDVKLSLAYADELIRQIRADRERNGQ